MASTPEQIHPGGENAVPLLISDARKQMLIDNLQLEITERARKLRAQYAMQAQGLRARLEMRVNRIPHSLRHVTMEELAEKYSRPQQVRIAPPSPQKISYPTLSATTGNARGTKRSSDVHISIDKENEHPAGQLENPKKRAKTAATVSAVPIKPSRTASRRPGPTAVLSPKSHNSRTFPASPVKPASPMKASVLPKPTTKTVAPKPAQQVRPASRQMKRPAAASTQISQTLAVPQPKLAAENRPSSGSDDSNGTTVMKKSATSTTTAAAAKKAAPVGSIRSRTAGIKNALSSLTGSKRAAASKKGAAAPATATATNASSTTVGGRTLRKRGSPAAPIVTVTPATFKSTPAVSTTAMSGEVTSVSPVKDPASPVKQTTTTLQNAQSRSTKDKALPALPPSPMKPTTRVASGGIANKRVASGRVDKSKRRSSGPKRLGSRRLGKVVEKGRSMFTRSRKAT